MNTPRILIIGGYPGSGKTTLGHALVDCAQAAGIAVELLDGDLVLTDLPSYSAEQRRDKAKSVLASALELNARGVHVVIAMGFGFQEQRDILLAHESATGVDLLKIIVRLPDTLRRERLLARGETPAQIAILDAQGYSDWPEEMTDIVLGAETNDSVRTLLGALLLDPQSS